MIINESMPTRFARFVVRPGCSGALIGLNVNGMLKEGVVYEVTNDFLGDIVLREVGPSPMGLVPSESFRRYGWCNAQTNDQIMTEQGGRFVMTCNALDARRENRNND